MLEKEKRPEYNKLYSFASFRLEPLERRLLKEGAAVPLTGKTFDLLLALVERAGRLASRPELLNELWPRVIVEEHNLTWTVSALRKALGDEGTVPRFIETVRGQGYRFIAPVQIDFFEETDQPPASPPARPPHRHSTGLALLVFGMVVAGVAAWGYTHFAPRFLVADKSTQVVAVLPFENLSADQTNAYFVAGIQDTILTKLSGIGNLRVISRTSTERYPSRPQNLKAVAAELGATAILEGSVQRSAGQVLINAQLIDARTDLHLWAQVYRRNLDDVFDVERDVAEQVATALKAKLLPVEAARVARAPTSNARAYDAFLRAEYLATQVEEGAAQNPVAAVNEGTRFYREAIAIDPGFALAYARLSYLESYAWWFDLDHAPERIKDAEEAARRALELDQDLLQAHLAMGYVHYWGRRDYAAALVEFERAQAGLASDANATAAIAFLQRRQGHWAEALSGLQHASELDPRNPRWFLSLGDTLTDLRNYAKAVAAYDRGLAIEPNDYNTAGRRIWALIAAGETAEARQALAGIPSGVDPEGLFSALRFEMAHLDRDGNAALAALEHAPAVLQTPLAVGETPVSLMRAQARALQGDAAAARAEFAEALDAIEKSLRAEPNDADLLGLRSRAESGLGRHAEAIRSAQKASELLPVSKDALYGLVAQTNLARAYAEAGDAERAVPLLRQLLQLPAGVFVSVPLLRTDPTWDRIRSDPRFAALLH